MARISVQKTYKLYIDGQFPRTESGRYYKLENKKGDVLANICLGSRKDIRNAVVVARKAQPAWNGKTAYNRSQIIYRIAEMLETRAAQFVEELVLLGYTPAKAKIEVEQSIDRIVYYAGWADKYQALFSSVNPVASSHFNFSVQEPSGVVCVIAPEESPLLGLISVVIPAILGGNTVVVLASEKMPLSAITFAEVLNSSDLPGGVVNIITGTKKELLDFMANHMDVNTTIYARHDLKDLYKIKELAVENVKRIIDYTKIDWASESAQSPYFVADCQELKTTWHPIEAIGVGGAKY